MLKIGEFARIGQVSIKALRHYDTIGLLPAAHIDTESGYRFYEMTQLGDLVRIMALKDCGFALEEIADLLRMRNATDIKKLLHQRIAIQQQLVADEQARLQRIVARLHQLEHVDDTSILDVALKRSEPLTLVGVRRKVATTQEIGSFAHHVVTQLELHEFWSIGPLVHIYYGEDANDEDIDLFIGMPIMGLPLTNSHLYCERLPGGDLLACLIYRGKYEGISIAYATLDSWLEKSGYHAAGPYREIYHQHPRHTNDPSSYVTEIQYPVQPVQGKN